MDVNWFLMKEKILRPGWRKLLKPLLRQTFYASAILLDVAITFSPLVVSSLVLTTRATTHIVSIVCETVIRRWTEQKLLPWLGMGTSPTSKIMNHFDYAPFPVQGDQRFFCFISPPLPSSATNKKALQYTVSPLALTVPPSSVSISTVPVAIVPPPKLLHDSPRSRHVLSPTKKSWFSMPQKTKKKEEFELEHVQVIDYV